MNEADAHLKSGGWVRVDEALPVVPVDQLYVYVWIVALGNTGT